MKRRKQRHVTNVVCRAFLSPKLYRFRYELFCLFSELRAAGDSMSGDRVANCSQFTSIAPTFVSSLGWYFHEVISHSAEALIALY